MQGRGPSGNSAMITILEAELAKGKTRKEARAVVVEPMPATLCHGVPDAAFIVVEVFIGLT